MQRRHIITTALFLLPLGSSAACVDTERALRIGMSGEDVRTLQIALNSDPSTQVAMSGPGSPGNESRNFGPATARALARFQEQFAGDILTPAGLTKGSGILGSRTRSMLRTLTCTQAKAASSDSASSNTKSNPSLAIPVMGSSFKPSDVTDIDLPDFSRITNYDEFSKHAEKWAKDTNYTDPGDAILKEFGKSLKRLSVMQREKFARNPTGKPNHFSSVPLQIEGMIPPSAWPGMVVQIAGIGFGATNTVSINGRNLEVFGASENGVLLPFMIPSDMLPGSYVVKVQGGISSAETVLEVLSQDGK